MHVSATSTVLLTAAMGVLAQTCAVGGSRPSNSTEFRLAIVGAGPAGSSSAYFASFLSQQGYLPSNLSVTVYERRDVVGGRSQVVHFDKFAPAGAYAEAGASIFTTSNNLNIVKAVQEFGLDIQSGQGDSVLASSPLAVWDGEKYAYSAYGPFKDYGFSFQNMDSITSAFVDQFLGMYDPAQGPYDSIASWADDLGWTELYQTTGLEHLTSHGVQQNFISDFLSASTSGNYAQAPDQMHAVESIVSWASSGASSVVGGNWQIYDAFLNQSSAKVYLNTSVTTLRQVQETEPSNYTQWELTTDHGDLNLYDAVIIAAPLHQTGIQMVDAAEVDFGEEVDYVDLHVTLVVTNATAPRLCYFFEDAEDCTEETFLRILSTLMPYHLGQVALPPSLFQLTYLKTLPNGNYIVKLFSPEALPDEDLAQLFGGAHNLLQTTRKEWQAFPYATPLQPQAFGPLKPSEGLYYTSSMERLISTMETSISSSWNVVSLLAEAITGNAPAKSWARWDD